MKIISLNKFNYDLMDKNGIKIGSLCYTSNAYEEAIIKCTDDIKIIQKAKGSWIGYLKQQYDWIGLLQIVVGAAGTINLWYANKQTYIFKRTGTWKMRLVIMNKQADEILAFLPLVNWDNRCFNYALQLNEDLNIDIDINLILLALHCAVYTTQMLNEN